MAADRVVRVASGRASVVTTRFGALCAALLFSIAVHGLPADRAISQYAHRAWRIEDGLPHSVVRGVAQTDDGYLWIATYEGLARFNGETFTTFNKANLPGVRRDTILSFLKARDGSLWIGTNGGGVTRLRNGKTETFGVEQGLPSDIVAGLAEDGQGTIWIGTSDGLTAWRDGKVQRTWRAVEGEEYAILSLAAAPDGTVWIGGRNSGLFAFRHGAITPEGALGNITVFALRCDPDGTLWVGAGDGLHRITNGAMSRIDSIPIDQVTTLIRDSDRNLWVGTYTHGLWRLAANGEVDHLAARDGLLNNSVRSLFEDAERTLWVGSNNGLESFSAGKFVSVGPREGLSDAYTRSAFEDREGNIWIGTAEGLNRISREGTKIFTTADGLSSDYVFAVSETPDGAIWIGTARGVNRFFQGHFTSYQGPEGIPSPTVRALHCDRSGTLWLGTDAGALRYQNGRFERVTPGEGWDRTFVQAFAESDDGSLWIGSDGRGIARWANGVFTVWNEQRGLPDGHILSLYSDHSRTLWIGTDSAGLIRMKDGKFTQYTAARGLPSDKVLQMLEDGDGRLWFGGGKGIWYASIDSLNGVAAGRTARVATTSFGAGDGIRSVQCNGSVSPSAIRTRDGRLWFPTVDGIATILPLRTFGVNTRRPPVMIEDAIVDGRHAATGQEIVVPAGARQLEIHYSALTYVAPQSSRFRYRLEGFDREWVDAANRHTAYYTGVPPGRYTFRVIAANSDGVWNERGASITVRIRPRFVETIWFPLLLLVLAGAVIVLLHLRRVHSMKRREADLVQLVQQRTRDISSALEEAHASREEAERQGRLLARALVEAEAANRAKSTFLANVSHELRTPLNAIIGFAHVLQDSAAAQMNEKQQKFMENIAVSGEHLLRLINEILDLAKIEAGKITLEPEFVEVGPLLASVAHTARGLMVGRGEVEVTVGDGVTSIVADPTKLKQIVYNLVSNAVKFSPKDSVVRISSYLLHASESPLRRESVAIAVTDDGVGIAPEHHDAIFEEFRQLSRAKEKPAGTGLGLALVRKFVELHQGVVQLKSAPGAGSTFTVVIPVLQVESESEIAVGA